MGADEEMTTASRFIDGTTIECAFTEISLDVSEAPPQLPTPSTWTECLTQETSPPPPPSE